MTKKSHFSGLRKSISCFSVFVFVLSLFSWHISVTYAADTLLNTIYIDSDNDGTVDHLKWIFDEDIMQCNFSGANWLIDVAGAINISAFTGVTQNPDFAGDGNCNGGDPVVYIAITAGSPTAGVYPVITYSGGGNIKGKSGDISPKIDVIQQSGISEGLVSMTLQDPNHNGQVNRIEVVYDNPAFTVGHVYSKAGWTVTDGGQDVNIISVELVSSPQADPLIFHVNLDESDPDLTYDTVNSDLEVSYTQNGALGVGTELNAGYFEINSIASGDGGVLSEIDGVPPAPVSATLLDANGGADGKLDTLVTVWSEDLNTTSSSANWSISSASDFGATAVTSMNCNSGLAGSDECILIFTAGNKKTDIGDLVISYATGGAVTDGTNTADSHTFSVSSAPVSLEDSAAPYPLKAEVFDTDSPQDGKLDRILVTWTEPIVAVANGLSAWAASSASDFTIVSTDSAVCNSGSAGTTQCDVAFTTSTVKTNVGNLNLNYTTNNSIKDAAGNLTGNMILGTGGNALINDMAAPIIRGLVYEDDDGDGIIDQFTVNFSEPLDADSVLSPSSLAFTNVGDFTGLSFDSGDTDDLAGAAASLITPVEQSATPIDTFDDSGNLAIAVTGNFLLIDADDNANTTIGAQTQATVTDGAAPVIKDFVYEDDGDGYIDQFTLDFSEEVTTASHLADNDLDFTNDGDFNGMDFGNNMTSNITSDTSTITIQLTTASTVQDTASTGIAITSANGFDLRDLTGNSNTDIAVQSQATVTDGAAPVPVTATFYDENSDGRLDLITTVWTEDIQAVTNGSAYWNISSDDDFKYLDEDSVECNSGSAGTNECDYRFSTATQKTDVGDLVLNYTSTTSVTDGINHATQATFSSLSTPAFIDGAAPAFVSASAVSDTRIDIIMSEDVTIGTAVFGDFTSADFTASSLGVTSGIINLGVASLGNTAFTSSDLDFTVGGTILDGSSNEVESFTDKTIADAQAPAITAGNLGIDDSACTGNSSYCIIGDIITFTWNNSVSTGDGNTDIATVTADLSAFGGSAAQPMYDNGLAGDLVAGNGVYSYAYTVLADNDEEAANQFTVTAIDTGGNSFTSGASADTAAIDNIAPVISASGSLAISDLNSNGIAEVGDTVSYTACTVSTLDTDSIIIDLGALTGDVLATEAGSPYTVYAGTLNGSVAFEERVTDEHGNITENNISAINVDNVSGTGFNSLSISAVNTTTSTYAPYNVSFQSALALPADGRIVIVFPAELDLSNLGQVLEVTGISGTLSVGKTGQTATIYRSGGSELPADTTVSFTLNSILNPSTAGTTGTFSLSTTSATSELLSSNSNIPGIAITSPPPAPAPSPPQSSGGGGGGSGVSANSGGGGGAYLANVNKKKTTEEKEEEEDDNTETAGQHEAAATSGFGDILGHWAESYIKKIAELGIVQGKTPENYSPNDNISRAELIKIAINAFKYQIEEEIGEPLPPDVTVNDWFAPYVRSAFENDLIFGFENGLSPNTAASRGMAVTILAKAAQFKDVEDNFEKNYTSHKGWTYAHFPDVPFDSYFSPYIAYFFDKGVINGYEDGSFGPSNPITRAEIAKIVVGLLSLIEN